MKSLNKILKNLGLNNSEIPKVLVSGLSTNSKNIQKGDLFIAIKGNKENGNSFITEAIISGAVAVITDSSFIKSNKVPIFKIQNIRKALSTIASEFYDHPSKKMTLVGITGTNGKTTTACLVKSILEKAKYKVAQIGTLGLIAKGVKYQKTLTTPDPITLNKILYDLNARSFSHVVMEVSSHAIDQYRVNDINFKVAAFTNITPEHLDYHKTFENYKNAKAKLFQLLTEGSKAIINIDDEFGKILLKELSIEVLPFSRKFKIGTYFKTIKLSTTGITGLVTSLGTQIKIESYLLGNFNSENILTAVSISSALNVRARVIEKGIKECPPVPGRMESFSLKGKGIAIIDYAHTPDAYFKVMKTLKEMIGRKGNIYVVFGAGGDRDKVKRPQMAKILETHAKHCFITPDNPRFESQDEINDQIIKGFEQDKYSIYDDRTEGIKAAINISKRNDIVAILGKGREKYQDIKGQKVFHSDLQIINNYSCE